MTKHLARELDDLHHDILSMCAMVEEMVHQAVDELAEPDHEKARAMAVKDDEIDEWDVRIEEECLENPGDAPARRHRPPPHHERPQDLQ